MVIIVDNIVEEGITMYKQILKSKLFSFLNIIFFLRADDGFAYKLQIPVILISKVDG